MLEGIPSRRRFILSSFCFLALSCSAKAISLFLMHSHKLSFSSLNADIASGFLSALLSQPEMSLVYLYFNVSDGCLTFHIQRRLAVWGVACMASFICKAISSHADSWCKAIIVNASFLDFYSQDFSIIQLP